MARASVAAPMLDSQGAAVMRCLRIVSMVVALVAFPVSRATAGAGANAPLDLGGAIGEAMKHNNALKIALEKSRESRARVREAWGMLWPELSTDVSYTAMRSDAGLNAEIAGVSDIRYVNGRFAVNPGLFYNSLQGSRAAHIAADNEVRRIRTDTVTKTIGLFYDLVLAVENVAMRRETVKALEENLRVLTVGYRAGTASKLEFLRANVSCANERTRLIIAENALVNAQAALNIQLGRDVFAAIATAGDIRAAFVDGVAEKTVRDSEQEAFVRGMIGAALRSRPEIIQVKMKRKIRLHEKGAAESVFLWPTFFAQGSYGATSYQRRDSGTSWGGSGDPARDALLRSLGEALADTISPTGWNSAWQVTFGATYRWGALSPLDSSHARADQAASRHRQADYEMEDFIKAVKLDVRQGFLKLKSAYVAIKAQEGNIVMAEESVRVAGLQYRNGIIDNQKFLDATAELATAKTYYIQALHDFQVAKAEINRAVGRDVFSF